MFNKSSLLLSKDLSLDFSEAKQTNHQCPMNIFLGFISESVSYLSSLIAAYGDVACNVWTYYLRKENRNSWQSTHFFKKKKKGGEYVNQINGHLEFLVVIVICSFKISLLFHLTRKLGNIWLFLVI